jgi:hypothetical protein
MENVRETVESMASQYLRYFSWRIEDGRIRTEARNNAVTAAENKDGKIPTGV